MGPAARVGLDVARAEAREAIGRPYLLVTRYDRGARRGRGTVHQEDACQALGIPSERKYAGEGGPSFRDLFTLTRGYARVPVIDVLKLVDAAVSTWRSATRMRMGKLLVPTGRARAAVGAVI